MAAFDGTITISNSEYRPCAVDGKKALFHKWEDRCEVAPPSAMMDGHNGGELRATFAIVEYEDGSVSETYPHKIKFLDSKSLFSQYCFQTPNGEEQGGKRMMLECKICGCEFNATIEKHYVSREGTETGLAAAFRSTQEPATYDTFDCPQCGCQCIAQERKQKLLKRTDISNEQT